MLPLARGLVSEASRIMLPIYVFAGYWIGYWYTFGPEKKLHGPSLTYAREVLPMQVWGVFALALATLIVAACLMHRRGPVVLALCVGGVCYLVWCYFYLRAGIAVPDASMVTPVWPLIAGAAHFASAIALSYDEVHTT